MIKIKVINKELKQFKEEESYFSLLIETDNLKILFDAGKGCEKINNIDYIMLSHGHFDHVNSLMNIENKNSTIITHPLTIQKRKWNGIEVGPNWTLEEIKNNFSKVILTENYFQINKNILFLGEIKKDKYPIDKDYDILNNGTISKFEDESALVIKNEKGLIIITGCSHKDIRNIIEYAKEITKEQKIYAVIGGFHLFNYQKTQETLNYFKNNNIKHVKPMHCLNEYAFNLFEKEGFKRLKTNEELIIE